MDSQFWFMGAVISVVSHVLLLGLLFVFGVSGRQTAAEDVSPRVEESAQAEASPVPVAETPSQTETSPNPPVSTVREYEVKAGDTLGAIARRIGCSVERLAEVNGSDVKTLSRLRIGQKLVLPD